LEGLDEAESLEGRDHPYFLTTSFEDLKYKELD
jgi:hypothetical protein